ncbi:MAG: tetratricopeptide repeat protein [Flavobacteriales bacterium]
MKWAWILFFAIPFTSAAQLSAEQEKKADSLRNVVQQSLNDTLKVNALLEWGKTIRRADGDFYFKLLDRADSICDRNLNVRLSGEEKMDFLKRKAKILGFKGDFHRDRSDYFHALEWYNESVTLSKKAGDKKGLAGTYNSIGIVYGMQADYKTCEEWMMKTLEIYRELDDEDGMASIYNNLGNIHYYQGDYKPAINFWTQSLKMKDKSGDKLGMANTLNNIGNIHKAQNDLATAIEYYKRSLTIYSDIDHANGSVVTSSNLAGIYLEQGMVEKAREMYRMCYEMSVAEKDKKGISDAYNGLGLVFKSSGQLDSAASYFVKSLQLRELIGDGKGIAETNNHLATVFIARGNINEAKKYAETSMMMAEEINSVQHKKAAAESLWKIYKSAGQTGKALEMHELFILMRDSLENQANRMEIIRSEFEYEYEKQMAADSIMAAEADKLKDAELHAKNIESRQRKMQNYILLGILVLSLAFGGILYHRFRVTNQQKAIIEQQKSAVDHAYGILEVKNREITDSITYAKRIQHAILPSKKRVQESLKDAFILFQPKDIVAGDFYWIEERDGQLMFAACDCTGHGVPGAMVSVICVNGLNRAVRENGLTDPAKILDKTREIVISEFDKSDDEVKDGMDVSLCSLSRDTMTLQWAGANNPLWIFRKESGEIEEIKADKQTIAKTEDGKPFTSHQLNISKGDIIYLFTDGYKDQFGGSKGKKFKASNLKKLLLSICNEPMETLQSIIQQNFQSWKGELEQVDDVCVIGVRI